MALPETPLISMTFQDLISSCRIARNV